MKSPSAYSRTCPVTMLALPALVWFSLSAGNGFWAHLLIAGFLVGVALPLVMRGSNYGLLPGALLESAPIQDGVLWEADAPTERVTCVIGDTERTLGYPPERWLDDPQFWPNHIALEDRDRVLGLCRAAMSGGQDDLRLEYRAFSARGETVWVENRIRVIRDAQGRARKLVGRLGDITWQKRLGESLRQSQKIEAVGRLAGGVAHDFNNLLTVIGGYADLLLASLDAKDPRRRNAEEIKKAGEHAALLTRQLLAFSRPRQSSPELVDLGAAVANLERMLRRLIGEDIDLVVVSRPGLGRVRADTVQLSQIIINLAVNARDAMPDGGRLLIQTDECEISGPAPEPPASPGRYATLTVTDTGCGMDGETRRRVFEPFFTTKEPGQGTGLGLTTVQDIVRENGGHIEVESAPGQGATFRIYLPRVEAPLCAGPVPSGIDQPPPGSETILVVEDEDNVRSLSRQILLACGYRVLEAGSGAEALELARRHPGAIDLLLADVVMPRMGGRELAGRLVLDRPALKVLYMSGYARDVMLRHAIVDPGAPCLQKPFTSRSLAQSVRKALDGAPESAESGAAQWSPAPDSARARGVGDAGR